MIRPAAVAGTFYPRDPGRLRETVDALLEEAPALPGRPRALIAPHAGYVYSGPVAARAFRDLVPPRRIVVIGPAHYVWTEGVVLPSAEAFRTPLGEVPVDREAVAGPLQSGLARVDDAAHAPEHAIEVELPFLQRRGELALLPLLVGHASPGAVAAVLDSLWDDDTLVVVSSDLSHFLDYDSARERDARTAARIESLAGGLEPDDACGHLAVEGLLRLARSRGLACTRLDLRNSGDTAGDRRRVVGYGAWMLA